MKCGLRYMHILYPFNAMPHLRVSQIEGLTPYVYIRTLSYETSHRTYYHNQWLSFPLTTFLVRPLKGSIYSYRR